MYHLFRRVHLYTGLVLLVFVLMYFATGYVLMHEDWFKRVTLETTTRTEKLKWSGSVTNNAMAGHLQATFGLVGLRNGPYSRPNGVTQFNFGRPGETFVAMIAADGKEVTITHRKFGWVVTAIGMHRLHGYNGSGLYWVWTLFYDLASTALILFALSGVYLWWKTTARKWPGFVCLGASFAYTSAMIAYLMLRK